MKKRAMALIMCMLLVTGNFANISNVCAIEVVGKDSMHQYKITPKNEEWKELKSHQDMLDVCQLSEETLEKSTTEELFDIVLDYPLLIDIELYNSFDEGISEVAKQFNGMEELLKREDFPRVLKEKYENAGVPVKERVNYSGITIENVNELLDNNVELRKEVYLDFQDKMALSFEERLLSGSMVLENYTESEKVSIVNTAYQKMKEKSVSSAYGYQAESDFFDCIYSEEGREEWKNIINDYYTVNYDESESVISVMPKTVTSNSLLNNFDSGAAVLSDTFTTFTIQVETPRGSKVDCIVHLDNKLNSDEYAARFKATYPWATVVSNGYGWNNCHAYAWASRQDIWMNDPSKYMLDGSYVEVAGNRPTAMGQKAMWNSIHSGVVTDYQKEDPVITSKWGGGCVMRCGASYVPYSGYITYYKYNIN